MSEWNPATILYGADGETALRIVPTQDIAASLRQRLIGDTFKTATLDAALWDQTLSGSGSITPGSGELRIRTGATPNSTALLRSKKRGRFLSGTANVYLVGARLSEAGTADNVRRWGAYDAADGYYFEMDGVVLNAVVLRASVATKVASTAWNVLSTTASALDVTLYQRYEILYFGNTAFFVVNGQVRHKFSGQVSAPRTNTLSFPMGHENANSGGSASDVSLFLSGVSVNRFGPEYSRPRFRQFTASGTALVKSGTGTLHRVVINRQGVAFASLALYDGLDATGEQIADIDLTKVVGELPYGVEFSTGLFASATNPGSVTVVFD